MTYQPVWRKSSFSGDGGTGGGDCVEAARLNSDGFVLRDSKDPGTTRLAVPHTGMAALVRHVSR